MASHPHTIPSPPVSDVARQMQEYVTGLQERICTAMEGIERRHRFSRDPWDRREGGGGMTRVLQDGDVFEKAGVGVSAVFGELPETMARSLNAPPGGFYATGISLVIHPRSPMIPTVHMNYRYFELQGGRQWFGGGSDLTPFYPYADDITHFHAVLKRACDAHDTAYYPRFKKWCDEYFFIRHRQESRGVGGIFFDYLEGNALRTFALVRSAGDAFLESYMPIVLRRRDEPWGEREREWQLQRRGRYVEFNLVYDRGTLFGLHTDGRIESILMSLPPRVRWEYCAETEPGSREAELVALLQQPREWVKSDEENNHA